MIKKFLHHLHIMKKARKHGDMFPVPKFHAQQAPNGSSETPTKGIFGSRIWKEVGWFRHSAHHISLQEWPSVHILHISDVHIRQKDRWLQNLCAQLQGIQPDIMVITGDIVTKNWSLDAVEYFLQSLPSGKYGNFAIVGNWEYWVVKDFEAWKRLLQRYNITLLIEEMATITVENTCLQILGTDDHLAGHSNISALHQKMLPLPTLALTHSPAHFRNLCHSNIQLVLAGHAHGGQIQIPLLGPVWVPAGTDTYIAGWYSHEQSHLFVSRGLGWSVAPIRWNTPPEIAHIFVNRGQI